MKNRWYLLFLVLWLIPVSAHAQTEASADVLNADGKKIGKAVFTETASKSVQLSVDLWDFKPGVHAMHIHNAGICEPPAFKSAGAHFNPEGKKHGIHNPEGPHAGDLPNIAVAGNGKGKINVIVPGITLSEGPHSILKEGGASLVFHAGPDDETTDPAGNSGDRIACGVIR